MKCNHWRYLLMFTAVLSPEVYAACLPAATNGDDKIICDSSSSRGSVNGLFGNDEIIVNDGADMYLVYGTRIDHNPNFGIGAMM